MNPFTETTIANPLDNPKALWRAASHARRRAASRRRTRSARGNDSAIQVERQAGEDTRAQTGLARRAWRCLGRNVCFAGVALLLPGGAMALNVNAATQEQLQDMRGIGPKTAQVIVQERSRGGSFESFDDLSERVKGIGPKKAAALKAAGLTVEGGPALAAGAGGAGTPEKTSTGPRADPASSKGKPARMR